MYFGCIWCNCNIWCNWCKSSIPHLPLIKKKEKKEYFFFSLHTLGAFGATVTFGAVVTNPCCCNTKGRVVPPFSFAKSSLIFTPHPVFCPSARLSARNPQSPCFPLLPPPNRLKTPRLPALDFVALSRHLPRDKIGIMSPPSTPAEMKIFAENPFQQSIFRTLFA